MKKLILEGAVLLCMRGGGREVISLRQPGEASFVLEPKPLNYDRRNKGDKKRQRSEWKRLQNKK